MALFDFASEADSYKRLLEMPEIGVTAADYEAPEPVSGGLMMPQSPLEKVMEKNGKAKTLGKMALTALSGGLLAPVLMPELMGAGKKYEAEMDAYKDDLTAQRMAERLESIDFDNLQPEDIAFLNAASKDLGKYGTDRLASQNVPIGTDHAVAEHAGVDYHTWTQRGDPQKQADRQRYQAHMGNMAGYNEPVLYAEGKTPEQLQQAEASKALGTGYGQEIIADRGTVTGIRNQYRQMQQGIDQTQMVRDLIANKQADPGKFRAGIRKAFGVETYEDGTMSAVAAQGVIDQIKQATFGAISEKELEMLYDGLINPAGSPESNMGRLDVALDRMRSQQEGLLGEAKLAWGRLSNHEDQADFLSAVADDDWAYLNLGEGSNLKPIHMMVDGEQKTVTFSEYYKARKDAAGPYEDLSREQIVIDYRKAREAEKELWEKQQKVRAELQEEARRALELEFME